MNGKNDQLNKPYINYTRIALMIANLMEIVNFERK